ncbi:ATP-binding protein [Thermodesulforhabdus norvegica]|uniref:histidine kinase n=1 Tax=Thermodesulforhabdus norvegica TaxID=39841 RepID=A0A1I4QRX2_9BACT|nr:HAMP domain-containing sensor histidine kinase [Thermodesulforhabdus norvegica]SFM42824.1 His Kinase A (phospho-acceptor) domain-containing protein [Thermodesulforhabdus norvegica]
MIDPHALMKRYFQAFLGHLVPGFIHNINSPLQVLGFALEFVEQDLKEQSETEKVMERIDTAKNQARALSEMVKDMRTLERMGTAEEPVIVGDALRILERVLMCDLFCKHNVRLEVQIDPAVGTVQINGAFTVPAICELLRNSLTALQVVESRNLIIKAYAENEITCLEVTDTGCGLPEDIAPEDLFEPGVSAWPEGIRQTVGYGFPGMGLYCVKEILKADGCNIKLFGKDGFTTARIELPSGMAR